MSDLTKKITLVTPPDFYENGNLSILFINLSEDDQDKVSSWLSNSTVSDHINIYFYSGESNVPWLLYALSRCEYKYIDIDSKTFITDCLSSYILTKTNVFYKTSDNDLAAVYTHVNTNKIDRIETFMESIFSGQTT